VGGVVGLVIIGVAMFFADFDTGAIVFRLSPLEVVHLLFLAFIFVRGLAILKAACGSSQNIPPEWEDWTETRNLIWVGAIGVVVSGALLFASISLWG